MINQIKNHPYSSISTVYFIFLIVWWLRISLSGDPVGTENYLFNFSYIFFNIVGGFSGLTIAHRKWGGFSSRLGKGLCFLGLGLLGQGFGLVIWTAYNLILKIEVPYPSLADIGYFSLIPFYSLAMWNFAHATGVKFALKTGKGIVIAVLIPFLVLLGSYTLFIRDIGLDLQNPLKTFLDIAYPAGEALAISLGLITLSLSRGLLGGKMKRKVEYIIIALVVQFITEFTFLYTSAKDMYFNASFVDLMYATSYFLMTLAILNFKHTEE